MRVLVTGASGFIGQRLGPCLLRHGHEVIGVSRRLPMSDRPTEVRSLVGDICELESWLFALRGVDALVHLAARVHQSKAHSTDADKEFHRVNVEATLRLARAAVEAGVRRFVFVSSVKVNGDCTLPGRAFTENDQPHPLDSYGASKYEAERGLQKIGRDSGMEIVVIRPPLVYGPGVKANFAALMRAVQGGWPLPLASVHNARSLVAVDNLVSFIAVCLVHPEAANQVFLVSDGCDLSTPDLVRGLSQAVGQSPRLFPLPVKVLRLVASGLGAADAMQRLCSNLQVDISKARARLGWVPQIDVYEGLRRAVGPESEA